MTEYKYDKLNNKVLKQISSGLTILDVGCDTGNLGKAIKASKNPKKLVGIEVNKKAASKASKYYDKLLVIDLDRVKSFPFNKNHFDVIVFADILEHLKNPEGLLKLSRMYLKKGGKIIVSVPNFLFLLVRLSIIFGYFKYRNSGVLDKSHLRFFTKSTIEDLVSECGYEIIKSGGYIMTRKSLSFLSLLAKACPSLFSYQILIVAKK